MRHRVLLKGLVTGCALALSLMPLSARPRGGGGAVFVGSGFGYYDPFWGPYPYGTSPYAGTGTIKFETERKDTAVIVDGGYAGTVGKLKSLHVRPGTYTIELRAAGTPSYTQKVYVVAGKTVKVNPSVTAQP